MPLSQGLEAHDLGGEVVGQVVGQARCQPGVVRLGLPQRLLGRRALLRAGDPRRQRVQLGLGDPEPIAVAA